MFFILAPIILLVIVLAAFALTQFVLQNMTSLDNANIENVGTVIRVILGMIGVVAVIWFLIGIPIGIMFFAKKNPTNFVAFV